MSLISGIDIENKKNNFTYYIFCELDCEEEEEEEVSPPKKKRFGMNPEVDTKYLPDRDRDEEVVILKTGFISD